MVDLRVNGLIEGSDFRSCRCTLRVTQACIAILCGSEGYFLSIGPHRMLNYRQDLVGEEIMFCDEVGYQLVTSGVEVAVLGIVVAVAVCGALDVIEEVEDFDVSVAALFGDETAGTAAL